MSRYACRDPYWLTAKWEGTCHCGGTIKKGQRAFYYPNGKRLLCAPCSEKAAAEFAAAAADEAFMSGGGQ